MYGAPDLAKAYNLFNGNASIDSVTIDSTNAWTFKTGSGVSSLYVQNPAATFSYNILGAAIVANLTLTLPLISSNDKLAALGVIQTWTGAQTFASTVSAPVVITLASAPTGSSSVIIVGEDTPSNTVAFATTNQTGNIFGRRFGQATITNPSATAVVSTLATVYVVGAPIASTNTNFSTLLAGIYLAPASSAVTITASQTLTDFAYLYVGQHTLTGAATTTVTNASSIKIVGAPIQGTNVTITNNYALWVVAGTTVLQATTMAGTLTMSSANIALGSNSMNTNIYSIKEITDDFGRSSLAIVNNSTNDFARLILLPNGAGVASGIIINRTSSLTNYETMLIGADQNTTGEFAIMMFKGGTGANRPINVYMQSTKLLSFDTANTITNYVDLNVGANKIKTTNYSFNENATGLFSNFFGFTSGQAAVGVYVQPSSGNTQAELDVFRTNDILINYEVLRLASDQFMANSFDIIVSKAGSGSYRALNMWNNNTLALTMTTSADIVIGSGSAQSTSTTGGFLIIPSCAGAPTGTPTNAASGIPMIYDTTDHRLYIYEGGAWHYIARTA